MNLIEDVPDVTGGIGDATGRIADRVKEVRNPNADVQNRNCRVAKAIRGLKTERPPGGGQ